MRLESENPVVAVVGSLNIDLIAYAQRVPNAGETLIGDDFRMGFGGLAHPSFFVHQVNHAPVGQFGDG